MIARIVEPILFRSRWLMAPFYLGLVIALLVLLFKFGQELLHFVSHAMGASESETILGLLSLVDLTLTGNLVLIVIFSGYENFVSKIDAKGHPNWPEWISQVDFAGLKQKLLASIVAISAIALLKAFMNLGPNEDTGRITWLVIIHVVFVVSSLILALSDKLSAKDH